ncbi:hypothetical protein ACFS5M_00470 [Lacinutrix iliipiscaria]|uniref:Lipocalin-like domain-containing protein n=1 Tax=Lacinutrix iliipiscaria TaxID=1230532 RepID=A0ABW5WHN2_9FLAO
MFNLYRVIILSALLFPLNLLAQDKDCCSSEKELESVLSGYWKIKDDDSKSLYHYWFKNNRGNVETVQTTGTVGQFIPVENSHSYTYIKKVNDSFVLEYIYRYGNWTSVIKQIDENNLVLETNGEITKYYKIKY